MKQFKTVQCLLALAVLALCVAGCATGNVNPSRAHGDTGYVDFYTGGTNDLNWQVARFDDRAQGFVVIFSELNPPDGGFLRLAFAPGQYRLQVTFLNRIVSEPGQVELEVKDGMITPVRVALVAAGTTQVQSKEMRLGKTIKGYSGRKNEISTDESDTFQISAVADAPVPYQPKERTAYVR